MYFEYVKEGRDHKECRTIDIQGRCEKFSRNGQLLCKVHTEFQQHLSTATRTHEGSRRITWDSSGQRSMKEHSTKGGHFVKHPCHGVFWSCKGDRVSYRCITCGSVSYTSPKVSENKKSKSCCICEQSLIDVESRYSQTEKEALAIVSSVERLHTYLYGSHFTLYTDLLFRFKWNCVKCIDVTQSYTV